MEGNTYNAVGDVEEVRYRVVRAQTQYDLLCNRGLVGRSWGLGMG